MKYIFPHPGSSHLYVRRWADSEHDDVVASVSVERGLAVDDVVADDGGCFVTRGGAGAMGQRRLELCNDGGDAVVAQLTTMIAAAADDSGTNMPLTLVSITGSETGFDAACSPATVVTITAAGCCRDELLDEGLSEKCTSAAAAAASLSGAT